MRRAVTTLLSVYFVILLLAGKVDRARAEDMPIPVDLQYKLLVKIYSFDRSIQKMQDKEILIGLIYQHNVKSSLRTFESMAEEIRKRSADRLCDRPLRSMGLNLNEETDLAKAAADAGIDIFYVCPLRAVEIDTIWSISRVHKVRTITGVPAYVASGLAVGLDIKAESPEIIINRGAAAAEGADFDAQLLKLARVINEPS